jgi:ATP-dependent Clp protease ATP-binding subunit ClpB
MQHDMKGVVSQFVKDQIMARVKQSFKPEFLNRLEDIIIFNPLSLANLGKIVHNQMANIAKLLESREIKIKLDDSAVATVLEDSYDPLYGARPLRRYLEKAIVTQLSMMTLQNKLKNGSSIFVYSAKAAPKGSIVAGNLAFEVVDCMVVE